GRWRGCGFDGNRPPAHEFRRKRAAGAHPDGARRAQRRLEGMDPHVGRGTAARAPRSPLRARPPAPEYVATDCRSRRDNAGHCRGGSHVALAIFQLKALSPPRWGWPDAAIAWRICRTLTQLV